MWDEDKTLLSVKQHTFNICSITQSSNINANNKIKKTDFCSIAIFIYSQDKKLQNRLSICHHKTAVSKALSFFRFC